LDAFEAPIWFSPKKLNIRTDGSATDNVFIRHEANLPSGGSVTEIDIGDFLSSGPRNPEHQALLQLIGTLVEGDRLPHTV
jgi:hypothetical protein